MSALEEVLAQALDWGLVTATDIVDGDLTVSSSARRNLNLRLERRRAPSYLIKRADLESGVSETISNESRFYRFCANEPGLARVAALMPSLAGTFESDQVLALELVSGARSLWQVYCDHGPRALPTAPPRELGRAMATLHAAFAEGGSSCAARPPGTREGAPGYFWYHEPSPQILRTASPARLALCRSLQDEPAIGEGLAAAWASWQRSESVIHGDVRSENLLILDGASDTPKVLLVDWELAQIGDPAWDLAGAFEDHVRFWLDNMSQRAELAAQERLATARWPLASVQTALRALCAGYREEVGLTPAALAARLERATTFSAARLLQTAWENCRYLEHLSSLSVLLVQVAANILSDPGDAVRQFYGLAEVLDA